MALGLERSEMDEITLMTAGLDIRAQGLDQLT